MTTVWRRRRMMARRLLADTSKSVQSGCRSIMKKVTNSGNNRVYEILVGKYTEETVGKGAEAK